MIPPLFTIVGFLDSMPCILDLASTNMRECFKNIALESHISPLMKSASQNLSVHSREQNLTHLKSCLSLVLQDKKTERISVLKINKMKIS